MKIEADVSGYDNPDSGQVSISHKRTTRDSVSLLLRPKEWDLIHHFVHFLKMRQYFYFIPATNQPICTYLCERRHSEGHLQAFPR